MRVPIFGVSVSSLLANPDSSGSSRWLRNMCLRSGSCRGGGGVSFRFSYSAAAATVSMAQQTKQVAEARQTRSLSTCQWAGTRWQSLIGPALTLARCSGRQVAPTGGRLSRNQSATSSERLRIADAAPPAALHRRRVHQTAPADRQPICHEIYAEAVAAAAVGAINNEFLSWQPPARFRPTV